MARPIRDAFELAEQLDGIRMLRPADRPLLGFFLFDERHTHDVVLEFARREYDWLNALASTYRMLLFFFLPAANLDEYANAEDSMFLGRGGRIAKNPSLEVARAFGLVPEDLPGVIFFTELDLNEQRRHDGVYWALSADLFKDDGAQAEARLSEMFGAVQEARAASSDLDGLLAALRTAAESKERAQPARRGIWGRRGGLKPVASDSVLIEVANLAAIQGLGI
jgi:hypothetical protein